MDSFILNELIRLSNELDKKGLTQEADLLDGLLTCYAAPIRLPLYLRNIFISLSNAIDSSFNAIRKSHPSKILPEGPIIEDHIFLPYGSLGILPEEGETKKPDILLAGYPVVKVLEIIAAYIRGLSRTIGRGLTEDYSKDALLLLLTKGHTLEMGLDALSDQLKSYTAAEKKYSRYLAEPKSKRKLKHTQKLQPTKEYYSAEETLLRSYEALKKNTEEFRRKLIRVNEHNHHIATVFKGKFKNIIQEGSVINTLMLEHTPASSTSKKDSIKENTLVLFNFKGSPKEEQLEDLDIKNEMTFAKNMDITPLKIEELTFSQQQADDILSVALQLNKHIGSLFRKRVALSQHIVVTAEEIEDTKETEELSVSETTHSNFTQDLNFLYKRLVSLTTKISDDLEEFLIQRDTITIIGPEEKELEVLDPKHQAIVAVFQRYKEDLLKTVKEVERDHKAFKEAMGE